MAKVQPRGIRNNNPLNIKLNPKNNWIGKIAENTDGTFEQFRHIVYGIRAAIILIRGIIRFFNKAKDTNSSVAHIIERYAREDANTTRNYVSSVCRGMGVDSDYIVDFADKDAVCSLVYEMAKFENGKAIDMLDVRSAYNMAIRGCSDIEQIFHNT